MHVFTDLIALTVGFYATQARASTISVLFRFVLSLDA